MRAGLAFSIAGHLAILAFGLVAFPDARSFKVDDIEAFPVDLVPIAELRDLAAGDLIVHEAGGRVSDLNGVVLTYNKPETRQAGLVACGAGLHDEIIHHTSSYERR